MTALDNYDHLSERLDNATFEERLAKFTRISNGLAIEGIMINSIDGGAVGLKDESCGFTMGHAIITWEVFRAVDVIDMIVKARNNFKEINKKYLAVVENIKQNLPASLIDFFNLEYVGTFCFKEYPSTIVLSNQGKTPFIVEWCDVKNEIDKFYIYESSVESINKFINKQISHLKLITSNREEVFIFEGSLENAVNIKKVKLSDIQQDYLPQPQCFFDEKNTDELETIKSFFNI